MAGKRGPSEMMRRSSSLRLVPSTSVSNRAKKASIAFIGGMSGAAASSLMRTMMGATAVAHEAFEQGLLAREIEVERALGDAGARRHVVEPRGLEAVLGESEERRIEDGLPACLWLHLRGAAALSALAARCGSLARWGLPDFTGTLRAARPYGRRCRFRFTLLLQGMSARPFYD